MYAVPAGDKLGMLCDYMQQKIGIVFNQFQCQGFAVLNDNQDFVAAVLVSNITYTGVVAVNCEVSCASETPLAWQPHIFKAVFQYVFGQLGCARCTAITTKNNTKGRGFLEALNFTLEGNIRKGYDGKKDALIYGLLAEECRFFGGLDG